MPQLLVMTRSFFIFERRSHNNSRGSLYKNGMELAPPTPDTLTILMVTSNNLRVTQLCLSTLLHYVPNLPKIVVADRSSTDGTWEYLKTLPQVEAVQLPAIPGSTIESTQAEHGDGLDHLIKNHLHTPWGLTLDTDVEFLRPGFWSFLCTYAKFPMSFVLREGYPHQLSHDAINFLVPCPHPSFLLFRQDFLQDAYNAGLDVRHFQEPMLPWYNRAKRWWVYHYEAFGRVYRWAYERGLRFGYIDYAAQDLYFHYGSLTVLSRCKGHDDAKQQRLEGILAAKYSHFVLLGLPLPESLRGDFTCSE